MPEPIAAGRRYLPGLDGLRAIAVAVVILYHLGYGWASGGLLGVGVFFTLSGYLITDLLLAAHTDGRLRLRDFWLARARRLLPALLVMLAIVSVWTALADPGQLALVRGQVLAALVYLSNWWQSYQHISYFARFGAPSPLNHLWSLSVEEQFYLLWPWLLLLGVRVVREPAGVGRPRLAAATLALAAASALELALLYHPSFDPSRLYYGTDTRAFGLLIGAALAMLWPSRDLSARVGTHAPWLLDIAGVVGLVGIGVLVWRTTEYSPFVYRGGLVLLSLATALVILAVVHPAARIGKLLGWGPLRWLGVRSYAIYLWHAPVIVLTDPAGAPDPSFWRSVWQVALSIALAGLSWRLIEDPIRHGAAGRWWASRRSAEAAGASRVVASVAGAAALVAVLALAGVIPAATDRAGDQVLAAAGAGQGKPARSGHGSHGGAGARVVAPPAASGPTAHGGSVDLRDLHTSCRSVVHFGDSTSEGLVSSDYLPDPAQRLAAQYARVGVRRVVPEITGGTSVIETLPGGINAYRTAQSLRGSGYHGCWVIALGTNDAADVYVGSNVSLAQRVRMMMSVIGSAPVLWVNARTLVASGPYAESNEQGWNAALTVACRRYPNMRIYDWASAVKRAWFIPDGIHYYSDGYAARAELIADALALAFPARGPSSSGCTVETGTVNVPVLGVGH